MVERALSLYVVQPFGRGPCQDGSLSYILCGVISDPLKRNCGLMSSVRFIVSANRTYMCQSPRDTATCGTVRMVMSTVWPASCSYRVISLSLIRLLACICEFLTVEFRDGCLERIGARRRASRASISVPGMDPRARLTCENPGHGKRTREAQYSMRMQPILISRESRSIRVTCNQTGMIGGR
ncbi:hypothetical protein CALVIDRAFT_196402 [Calocera viscosa TUFC12733]|uniref:Uncharacterized protein n=1 Tax=Calocera viscosa (strain TUFC12733) TaxID=1330018 RepID=A0A167KHR1_CALVF|nr:hypothetical protein CALVIDRAFT_196402 [Calocera viscosa TUFC12733]